jgi:hypothetical protein
MKQKRFIFLALGMYFSQLLLAQLSGTVSDEQGQLLPFASVYELGGKSGATTNEKGQYQLNLSAGAHTIVFQFIGYRKETKEIIVVAGKPQMMHIRLTPNELLLSEVTIRANAEDPAYAIMREAIARRKQYRNAFSNYDNRAYVKGLHKLKDAPTKIMGRKIGDMGGMLDSSRQGVIYLSESVSRLYFAEGGKVKEVMESSKVSGDDNGFSFNRAAYTVFSLFDETTDLFRPILSPLADNAFQYYKFKLIGTYRDEKGNSIARIELLPKRSSDPVYHGYIEVMESEFCLTGIDIYLTGKNIQQPLLDTLHIKQSMAQVQAPNTYAPMNQVFEFGFKIIGFKYQGLFTTVFSDYIMNAKRPAGFWDKEEFKIEQTATLQSDTVWDALRPIPLTPEEVRDYTKKDSIQVVRNSPAYLDSMDRRRNRFRFGDIFFGYDWQNTRKHTRFQYNSPISSVQYNTVQGWASKIGFSYQKAKDAAQTRYYELMPTVSYGFGDKKWRGGIQFEKRFESIHYTSLSLKVGRELNQINTTNPISPLANTLVTLIYDRNYLKIYEQDMALLQFKRRMSSLLHLAASISYAKRNALTNFSDQFIYPNTDIESSNNPAMPRFDFPAFASHLAAIGQLEISLHPGTRYETYPNKRNYIASGYPTILIGAKCVLPQTVAGSDRGPSLQLQTRIGQVSNQLGIAGSFSWNFTLGTLLHSGNPYLLDYQHFDGNQTVLGLSKNLMNSFQLLPYYSNSTKGTYTAAHIEHQFHGFLFDKIPGIRKLGLNEIISAHALHHLGEQTDLNLPAPKTHLEFGIGLGNIGWKAFRIFRFDYFVAPPIAAGSKLSHRFIFGIGLGSNISGDGVSISL